MTVPLAPATANTDLLRQKHVGRGMMTGSVEKTTHIHKKILCLFIFIPSQSIIFIEGQIVEIPLVLVLVPVTVYLIFPQLLIGVQWIWHFTLCWRRLGSFLQAPKVWFEIVYGSGRSGLKRKQRGLHLERKNCVTKQFNDGKKDCDESDFFCLFFPAHDIISGFSFPGDATINKFVDYIMFVGDGVSFIWKEAFMGLLRNTVEPR